MTVHIRAAKNHNRPPLASSWRIILALFGLVSVAERRRRCGGGGNCVGDIGFLFVQAEEGGGPATFLRGAKSRRYHRHRLPPPPHPRPWRRSEASFPPGGGSGVISGRAFFDSNNDGTLDGNLDVGVEDISVGLFACADDDDNIVNATTDASGDYSFEGLSGGSYYIRVPSLPSEFCTFSSAWKGKTDQDGELLHPDADSAVIPETGDTMCFDLAEGEAKTVIIGIKLEVPIVDNFGGPVSTPSPTAAPSDGSESTSSPLTAPTTIDPMSDAPSRAPVAAPATNVQTASPSKSPVSSPPPKTNPPSNASSSSPTRTGELYGPTTTKGMVMTIRGIEMLEDEEAWSAATSEYVMAYFNLTNDDPGAFDVTASIKVANQMSSNAELLERRQLRGWRPRRGNQVEGYVEVTYDQTSVYRTPDPGMYDGVYVATTPFSARRGSEWYAAMLRALSPHYEGVSSAEVTRAIEPKPDIPSVKKPLADDGAVEDGGSQIPGIVWLAVAVVVVLVLALGIFTVRKRKERNEQMLELTETPKYDADGLPARSSGWNEDGSPGDLTRRKINESSRKLDDVSRRISEYRQLNSTSTLDAGGMSSINHDIDFARLTYSSNTPVVDVIAPAGKIGIVIKKPTSGGPTFIYEIKDACPIAGQVQLGDKIIAVDEEDMRGMKAQDVTRLLATKSSNKERKITLRRDLTYGTTSVISVVAPAGKVGIVVETPSAGGPSFIRSIKDTCPIVDQVRPGDKIIAVDDEDVRELTAPDVTRLLLSKSGNPKRKISVLRRAGSNTSAFDVIAPAGKVGIVIETPLDGGPAIIREISDTCPIINQVQSGDKLIAVDDEDVREMLANDVSRLLASKSWQPERKITLLREAGGVGDADVCAGGGERPSVVTSEDTEELHAVAPIGGQGVIAEPPPAGRIEDVSPVGPASPKQPDDVEPQQQKQRQQSQTKGQAATVPAGSMPIQQGGSSRPRPLHSASEENKSNWSLKSVPENMEKFVYRAGVATLVKEACPENQDKIDEMMIEYEGREEVLIGHLATMLAAKNQKVSGDKLSKEEWSLKSESDKTRNSVYREGVEVLVKEACPEKMDRISELMIKYEGREEVLIGHLSTMLVANGKVDRNSWGQHLQSLRGHNEGAAEANGGITGEHNVPE